MSDGNNATIVEAWDTVLFEKFSRFRHVMTVGLDAHSDEAFARHPFPVGARVLDIGCGFGTSTSSIARRVGPTGTAVGVDCARNFIASAQAHARAEGVENASFFVADVQVDPLRGPHDHAFSRFGTMFFNLPGAALRNVRRALAPGGSLILLVWRNRDANPWLEAGEPIARQLVSVPAPDETTVHCGPGPFSMSSTDLVSDILLGAGYERISFERFDTDVRIGVTLESAVAFAAAMGPAGEILRLAGEEGVRQAGKVHAALRETLSAYARPDGIWVPSSSWIVSARNPR